MTAAEKLDLINTTLDAGRLVYLETALRITKISPATRRKFEEAGHPILKVSGDSLWLAEGRRYVCADYVSIRVGD